MNYSPPHELDPTNTNYCNMLCELTKPKSGQSLYLSKANDTVKDGIVKGSLTSAGSFILGWFKSKDIDDIFAASVLVCTTKIDVTDLTILKCSHSS